MLPEIRRPFGFLVLYSFFDSWISFEFFLWFLASWFLDLGFPASWFLVLSILGISDICATTNQSISYS